MMVFKLMCRGRRGVRVLGREWRRCMSSQPVPLERATPTVGTRSRETTVSLPICTGGRSPLYMFISYERSRLGEAASMRPISGRQIGVFEAFRWEVRRLNWKLAGQLNSRWSGNSLKTNGSRKSGEKVIQITLIKRGRASKFLYQCVMLYNHR